MVQEIHREPGSSLAERRLAARSIDAILAGLDEEQRACVVHPPGPMVIQAGAGSGKTRVLTRRIAYRVAVGDADARRVVSLTFTRRAAGELRQRLGALGVGGVHAGTVHAFARSLLERYWSDTGKAPRQMVAQPRRLLGEAMASQGVRCSTSLLSAEVEWAAARGISPEEYEVVADREQRMVGVAAGDVAAVFSAYRTLKRRRGVIDLGDLLSELVDALGDPTFAAATRWRFRHLLVDEAQDLNRAQWSVVRGLLGKRDDLCLVGDVDQAIYGWNGADARYLTRFEEAYPNAVRLRLSRNYRSTPSVVRASDRVLGALEPTPTVRPEEERGVTVSRYGTCRAEAQAVGWRIRQGLAEGLGCGQMAVLGRTHEVLGPAIRELRTAGIPVRTGRNLLDEPDVAEALHRLASAPPTLPASGCRSELGSVVDEMLTASVVTPGVDEGSESRLGQLLALLEEWADVVPRGSLRYLGDWLAATVRSRGGEPNGGPPAVEVATFHRAKGLEWRRVFVVGLEDGLVPLQGVDVSGSRRDEERRLLSVALTRGADRVHCSWAERRRLGGRAVDRAPSPYLARIEAATGIVRGSSVGAESPPDVAVARIRAIRAELVGRRQPA